MMTKPIPVLLCIDIEPDAREVEWTVSADAWTGFEKLLLSVDQIRDSLFRATGRDAHFTWFLRMDPQVAEVWGSPSYAADGYERELAELSGAGDEFGLHTHNWRWGDTAGRWISDRGDERWVMHCAGMALDSYRQAFGRPCAAYRHGDHAMTTALACFLDDAGVKVDLTVEPGLPGMSGLVPGELTTGWIPSTFNAPTYPYHPSRFDFRVPDPARDEGLLLVPLTRGLDVTVDREVGRPRGRWDTLALFDQPDRFRRRIRLRLADPALTHLAFAIRSDLPLRSELWSSFEANLAELCRHPAARELAFRTASDAVHEGLLEADRGGPAAQSRTSSLARAGLWARGDEDPGYIEGAELEAVRVLNHAITDGRAELTAEIAKGSQVGQWFEAASRELQAMRETKTWRAHDQAVSLVAAIRARLRRR